jgi:hypothetical protein
VALLVSSPSSVFGQSRPSSANEAPTTVDGARDQDDTETLESRALSRFRAGIELAREQRWAEALREFRESRALYPTRSAALNEAYCLEKLGRPLDALVLYEQLRNLPDEQSRGNAQRIERAITRLKAQFGELEVSANFAGARVSIDDTFAGDTPFTVRLVPGEHAIEVKLAGFQSFSGRVVLGAGQKTLVRVSLLPESHRPAPALAPSQQHGDRAASPWLRPVLELGLALGYAPSLGGGADGACFRDPSHCRHAGAFGWALLAHAGHRVTPRVTVSLLAGWLDLTAVRDRATLGTVNLSGESSGPTDVFQSNDVRDRTHVSAWLAGAAVSRRFLDATPLWLRLESGIARGYVKSSIAGTFNGVVQQSAEPYRAHAELEELPQKLWIPFIGADACIGYVVNSRLTLSAGLGVYLFLAPSEPRTESGTRDPERRWLALPGNAAASLNPGLLALPAENALGPFVLFLPGASARWEL